MAEVTGLTAARMQEISDASVVSGAVDGSGHLKLTTSGGSIIDAGDVVGPAGATGPTGPTAPAPAGSVIMFASATPPSGWVLCDGSALSRTTFSALFAVIGTGYGPGDGSTTFNVPDMRNRFPRHDIGNLGQIGGSGTHPHTHTISDHAHALSGGSPDAFAKMTLNSGKAYMQKINGVNGWTSDTNNDTGGTNIANNSGMSSGAMLGGNTAKAGSGTTSSDNTVNLPPYLNMAFIIKT